MKRQPQRTCLGCRQVLSKRALTRVVRRPDGQIAIDPTGKLAGRGAYLCPKRGCWLAALSHRRIGPALKAELSAEDCARIEAYALQLPAEGDADQGSGSR